MAETAREPCRRVLTQVPSLSYVDLCNNEIRDAGAESFARVMGQCPALSLLDLSEYQICDAGAPGAEILAGVMEQCVSLVCIFKGDLGGVTVRNRQVALAKLNFQDNDIETVGRERLRAS